MAKLYNLARMTTATTGTGTLTLGSAVSGFLSFSSAGVTDGDTVTYAIKDGANSEIGRGVYTASGTTLTRSVLKSTNSHAAINLSGSAEVFITAAAEDVYNISSVTAGRLARFTATDGTYGQTTGLYEDGSGFVGLGTTSPALRLHVFGAANAAPATSGTTQTGGGIRLRSSNSNNIVDFGVCNTGATYGWLQSADQNNLATNYGLALNPNGGSVGVGTTSPSQTLDVNDDSIRVRTSQTPASASASGNAGEIAWDSSYLYVCVASNTWKRVAIATW